MLDAILTQDSDTGAKMRGKDRDRSQHSIGGTEDRTCGTDKWWETMRKVKEVGIGDLVWSREVSERTLPASRTSCQVHDDAVM